jgi:hypothetical protein
MIIFLQLRHKQKKNATKTARYFLGLLNLSALSNLKHVNAPKIFLFLPGFYIR